MGLFNKKYTSDERELFAFLKQNRLFSHLSDDQMSEFIPYMLLRFYQKDEVVFFREDPSQALYIVKKGSVALYIDIDGKFELLTGVNAAGSFGDNTLVKSSKRLYNAVCTSDTTEIYVLPQVALFEIFEDEPKIKGIILEAAMERYNEYTANLFKAYKASFGFFDLSLAYKE